MKKRNFKRILFAADLHCGHRVGLTPPGWQLRPMDDDPKQTKWLAIQQECWTWYQKTVSSLKPFDSAVWLGDLIDGTGHRSGGTELICTDRNKQCDMAEKAIRHVGAPVNVIVAGTPYHAGEAEDAEEQIAKIVGAKFGSHEWLEVNGVVFDVKHFVGASTIPHGRINAVAREELWNVLWAESAYAPRADYLFRAHVHYSVGGWRFVGKKEVNFATMPALQAMGTKFGGRKCSGLVDYGFWSFDIEDNGTCHWHKHILFAESQVARTSQL